MKSILRFFLLIILCIYLLPFHTFGQTKYVENLPPSFWVEATIFYHIKQKDRLFAEFAYKYDQYFRFEGDFKTIKIETDRNQRPHFLIGFEHQVNNKWWPGISIRWVNDENYEGSLFLKAKLKHEGRIGSFEFDKAIGYEWILPKDSDSYGRVPMFVSLAKEFGKMQQWKIVGRYDLFAITQVETNDDSRTIDYTRLRFELLRNIHLTTRIGLFWILDTVYSFNDFREVVDPEGNVTVFPEGNRNQKNMVFGLKIVSNVVR